MTDINEQMLPPPMLARKYLPLIIAPPDAPKEKVAQAVENIANTLEDIPEAMPPIPYGAFRYTDPDHDLQLQTLITKTLRDAGVFDDARDGWLQVCEYLRTAWMAHSLSEFIKAEKGGDYA